ncbi:amino acid adenylation domain-containing protein [Paenibacillus sp. M1]|uniref:Amino acid adenylation domain-containing protein n=1 Tax=Paenibacillus haidiansis TaxID=1574488 RepID=A0ABU7VPV9_9BACL
MLLFCIPYAGSSSALYHNWKNYIDDERIQLCNIELKGKGGRYNEEKYIDFKDAVEDIYNTYIEQAIFDQEYAIFGHSMGAVLAYELYYKIKENNMPLPKHIFFSSMRLPFQRIEPIHELPKDKFLDYMLKLGGFDKDILENEELLDFCLEILRNDYRIMNTYTYQENREALDCKISVLYGNDEILPQNYSRDLRTILGKQCEFYKFEGGHFFINNNFQQVIGLINDTLLNVSEEFKYYKLLKQQTRIWYVDQINKDSAINNIGGRVKIHGHVDYGTLDQAYNLLLKNTDLLRLRIGEKDQKPYQYIDKYSKETLDFMDFSKEKEPLQSCLDWINRIISIGIPLEGKKLYYLSLYKLSQFEYGILFVGHHIAFDGWSIGILQRSILQMYGNLLNHDTIRLDPMVSLDQRLANEEKYELSRLHKDEQYWLEKVKEISEENYYNTFSELKGARKEFVIPVNVHNKLMDFVAQSKISINTFFVTLMYLFMYKTTNSESLAIGLPIYNRNGKQQKNTIGMFTNTVVCAIKVDSTASFSNLIAQVESEIKKCLYHQQYPYDLLVKQSGIEQYGYNSLYKNSVNFYNFDFITSNNELSMEIDELYCGEQTYSLQMIVKQFKQEYLQLCYDYKLSEYDEHEIEIMYGSMLNMLNQVISNPAVSIRDIQLIDEEERYYKQIQFNNTKSNYPREKTTIQLFEEQVQKTPDAAAVESGKERITFRELDELSNQIANFLNEKNVTKNSVVGIMISPSIYLIACILAVLKKGAIYLPIDAEYPEERVRYELDDSNCVLLLTDELNISNKSCDTQIVNITEIATDKYSKEFQTVKCNSNDIVYIIYTSGSTGKPKGVLIKQGGLVNYLWWAAKNYLKDAEESMPLFTSIAFDLTITTIFAPIISGNKIICYPHKNGEPILKKIIEDNRCTVMKLTPSHLKLLESDNNTETKLKRLIVGGEELKVRTAKNVTEAFGGKIEIYNEYGPTETVVGCMIHKYDVVCDHKYSVPIGYPADNVQIYILNKDLNIVPDGIPGEMYIGGDGVSKGYLNQEDTTNRSFIPNPFVTGELMYRTFDTAKYVSNGGIEYLGRNDNQMKMHGYRIELGEIENCLQEYECIDDAVVICNTDNSGKQSLDAYLVSEKNPEVVDIRNWLLTYLPHYMIPGRYFFMDKIPLTTNGKVDHRLLPKQQINEIPFAEASTPHQKVLVDIMKEVLEAESISMNDYFYNLGGDSISAILISSKLKEEHYEISVKDIIMSATIHEIADKMQYISRKSPTDDICEGFIRKTPIMRWFFAQELNNPNWYNHHLFIEMSMDFNYDLVNKSIHSLISYEDTLRLKYDTKSGEFYYENVNTYDKPIEEYDLSDYAIHEQKEMVNRIGMKLSKEIDMSNSMFQKCVIHTDTNTWGLLFVAHHLIIDGISWRILVEDFLYAMQNQGVIDKKIHRTSYQHWANELIEYSEKKDLSYEIDYWNAIEDTNMGYHPDSISDQATYSTVECECIHLDAMEITDLAKEAKEKLNVDLNEILLIGLVLSVYEIYRSEDIVIENEGHGREEIGEELDISRTIGWFTTIYPIHFKVNSADLDSNLRYLKEQIKAVPNKGFNYQVLRYLNQKIKHNSRKYIRFNFLGNYNSMLRPDEIIDLDMSLVSDPLNKLSSLIDINSYIKDNSLIIRIEFSKEMYRQETIHRLADTYTAQLMSLMNYFKYETSKQFTPSDFDTINLSFEDLDKLFN